MRRWTKWGAWLLAAQLIYACGEDEPAPADMGTIIPDVGEKDAGVQSDPDLGVWPDAAAIPDTGTSTIVDAGRPDLGPPDMGVDDASVDMGVDVGPIDMGRLPWVPTQTTASVYWVGQSQISHRDITATTSENLMEIVGTMAGNDQLAYRWYDHTSAGAHIGWNWSGTEYTRELRREILDRPRKYDVLVMIEGTPVAATNEFWKSPWSARNFACALRRGGHPSRVYIYQGWNYLHALDDHGYYPAPHVWDWRADIAQNRSVWEFIAEKTSTGTATPSHYDYGEPLPAGGDPGICMGEFPVYIVPVADAFAQLYNRLETPLPGDEWTLADGTPMLIDHLFQNGWVNWPADWPLPPEQAMSIDPFPIIEGLTKVHPNLPKDDVHASQLGVYFVGLVHYATIYARSPVGLPALNTVTTTVARQMQQIVWDVVRADPWTGVPPHLP